MAMAVIGAVAIAPMVTLSSFRKAQFLVAAGPASSERSFERNGKKGLRNLVSAVLGEKAPSAAVPDSAERGMLCNSRFQTFFFTIWVSEFTTQSLGQHRVGMGRHAIDYPLPVLRAVITCAPILQIHWKKIFFAFIRKMVPIFWTLLTSSFIVEFRE